jgi:hypothetical protein
MCSRGPIHALIRPRAESSATPVDNIGPKGTGDFRSVLSRHENYGKAYTYLREF